VLSLDYIAGLIDCDGSICISYRKRENAWAFVVNFRQLEKARFVLEDLQETLGAGKIYRHSGAGPQKMLTWQTTKIVETEEVCIRLHPYLRIKQNEATLMLAAISWWQKYRNGYITRKEADEAILRCKSKMNYSNQTGRVNDEQ
jgi:hypothetical protein